MTLTEPERGFEPGSAGYIATALPFELSSIDLDLIIIGYKLTINKSSYL